MIELFTAVAVYYVIGCIALAFSDKYKLEALPFFKRIGFLPSWLFTDIMTLSWPYVIHQLSKKS